MLENLATLFVPMCLGYLWKLKDCSWLRYFRQITLFALYGILFSIGFSLGQLDDLATKLPQIGITGLTFIVFIQSFNFVGLLIYDKRHPAPLKQSAEKVSSQLHTLLEALKLCLAVIVGFVLGFMLKNSFPLSLGFSTYFLMAILFCVGIELRNGGIAIRNILINRRAMITGVIFILTSWFGGILGALILNLPITQGLAVSSSFGWYSLSSVTLHHAWGPVWGSIAFFNDLVRELLSLFIVPFLIQHYRSTAIGFTGATSLDSTLPIIQKSGGIEVMPFAISFGFITNVLPPILLTIFTSIPI